MKKKIKNSARLLKSRVLLALFIGLFAGAGGYALVNSKALTPGYTRGNVLFHVMNSYNNAEGVQVIIQFSPVGSTFPVDCTGTNVSVSGGSIYARTNSLGYVDANCAVSSQGAASKQYVINNISSLESGFTLNNGGYHVGNYVTIPLNGTVQANIYMDPPDGCGSRTKNNTCDSDGDGIIDSGDGCPSQAGPASNNGCPLPPASHGAIALSAIPPTTITMGGTGRITWSIQNANNCTLNGAASPLPSHPTASQQNVATPALNATTTYSLTCSESNYPSSTLTTSKVTFAVICPSGKTGTPPNCTSPSTGGGGGGGGSSGSVKKTTSSKASPAVIAADKTAPSAPGDISATQTDSSTVDLTWNAASDNVDVASYSIDRSTDASTWSNLAAGVSDTKYTDSTIDFNTHYYYRVIAFDGAGNASSPGSTEITTSGFSANITAADGGTIKSDDGIVVMKISSGTFDADASCSITNNDTSAASTNGLKLVAGQYELSCKDAKSDDITTMNQPVDVTMNLNSFKSYNSFKAYTSDESVLTLLASTYNPKDKQLDFQLTDFKPVSAYGAKKGGGTWVFFIVPLLIVLLFAAVIAWIRSRGGGIGGGSDGTMYDTGAYTLPVDGMTGGAGPTFTPGGPEQHTSLPDLVAQDLQQQAGVPPQQYPLPPEQQPPYVPQQPQAPQQTQAPQSPLPPQPPAGPGPQQQ
jgi:hypothetical protein